MRVKRVKHCKKHLAFYKTTFGFREPYQILIDMTFCQHALMCKINIKEQISNYIGEGTQLFTTQCIIAEGEMLGPQVHGALHICKQFKLRKCNHTEKVSAQECIESMIGKDNSHHLFVASQDHQLQLNLRKCPGVPIVRIHYNALVLEKPNFRTKREANNIGSLKSELSNDEKQKIKDLKTLHSIKEVKEKVPQEKRVKGVNPLAMKKKKKKDATVSKKSNDSSKVRRRKKIKIASHVMEELKKKSVQ